MISISCENQIKSNAKNTKDTKDSLAIWIKEAKKKTNTPKKRKKLLEKSYLYLLDNNFYDSKLKTLSDIAYQTLLLKDTVNFFKRNKKVIQIALKEKDSFALGDAFWNYASLFVNSFQYEKAFQNFHTAQTFFKNHPYYQAKMLVGKAFIRGRYLDNIGKEKDLVNAISIFNSLKKYNDLASSYNSLGINTQELGDFQKAVDYYKKALEFDKKGVNKSYIDININLGKAYRELNDYENSLSTYERLFKILKKNEKPKKYAILLDNYTYTQFLSYKSYDTKKGFFESLRIRDSLNDREGILISKIHLSEYYKKFNNTLNAIRYAKEANDLAIELNNSRDILRTYKLLSELDTGKSKLYLNKYIRFSDSLLDLERSYRNKFARIELDTDNYIEENEKLIKEKTSLILIGSALLIIFVLVYFLIQQKNKNQKLKLEKEKQELNEELYQLSIHQKEKLEKEKIAERRRISEDLHDGILGKLFGTRLALGYLDLKLENKEIKKYKKLVDDLQLIEKDLRDVSHQLNENLEDYNADYVSLIHNLLQEKSSLGSFSYVLNEKYQFDWEDVAEVVKINCYKILQEVLNNIIKHSHAKEVIVNIQLKEEIVFLEIKDDGVGFKTSKKVGGIGLKNITSRVKRLRGSIKIKSEINQGSRIIIKIPKTVK